MAGSLETYHAKRNFRSTREPRGRKGKSAGNSFCIQKHDATRLHYDFRLEMDGVLKSWAVTRGPSLDPEDKRLAVHVEDHPLDYGDFEGTIPKGEYGGGTVLLWDRGTWTPDGDPHRGYAKGHMEFTLDGEKLKGRWHLVRMHGRGREKRENWLLIKGDDEFARPGDDGAYLKEAPLSVKTGRELGEIAGEKPGWSSKAGGAIKAKDGKGTGKKPSREKAKAMPAAPLALPEEAAAAPLPDFVEPQLATLVEKPPEGDDYIHEIKFDGYRLLARLEKGKVTFLTRTGLDWTERFGPGVAAAIADLPAKSLLLDGELVVEREGGISDFSALQADLSEDRHDRFRFYAFDILHLDGHDLRELPLAERKSVLERLIPPSDVTLRFSGHFADTGADVLAHACRLGLEGIVSKRADLPYRSGRSRSWLKAKCSARQEFVIGGYVPSSVSNRAIGALVLGVFEGDNLVHVGKVGTGFSRAVAESLFRQLQPLRTDRSPFAARLTSAEAKGVRFLKPEKVAEIEFRAWTGDGHLRHASFRGLREDKDASAIRREAKPASGEKAMPTGEQEKPAALFKGLTHPDRIYWPEEGVTKLGLAEYYAEMWDYLAPFVTGRALALLRCPEGINGERFFQKHKWRGMNAAIQSVKDPGEPDEEPLLSIRDVKGIVALAQSAALEIHPWGSTLKAVERPDMLILDLDPGEGVAWTEVIEGATFARRLLEEAGLAAYVKTSGGKGLHVVAPLKPKADWDAVKAYTKSVADRMADEQPDRYVSTITKAKRVGKIFVDYLRNQRGMTAVAPYSPRARPGAPVSMPVFWEELSPAVGPQHFTLMNAVARMDALSEDPWKDFWEKARPLP
ncbi:DNA ligase D [Gellertiella hungarica]|uniref:DNA ligase (ATP) n=1 Tax=Gellertiella hungarica TaxID=1572859 RepID=A0A7W6NM38_9HYPH|nr:DNA ligase D [Gellertiella hungarica]MBB4067190.1 bifunctional non-homologous end joining protein LigD [Gellertiella hungarica]